MTAGTKRQAKPFVLVQLDSDPHASVFDSVVAVDSGVDHLLAHASVAPEHVRDLGARRDLHPWRRGPVITRLCSSAARMSVEARHCSRQP